MKPVTVGAVLYDPKVSIIWDIIREFFEQQLKENGRLAIPCEDHVMFLKKG